MSKEHVFPNGLDSYLETYYEIVDSISFSIDTDKEPSKIYEVQQQQGRGGLYELAKELTDKFENLNKGREWDGEFFDEIDEFLNKELYERSR